MYGKNDYRYYLEHRLAESDDYLAHYGVKGMKWKHRKSGNTIHIPIITDLDAPARRAAQDYKVQQEVKKAEDRKLKNRIKKKIKPKNQKVTIITDSKRKRSKKEAAWNNEMKGYAKQVMSEGSHKRKKK